MMLSFFPEVCAIEWVGEKGVAHCDVCCYRNMYTPPPKQKPILKMPLFSRPSIRSGKKPVKRKSASLTNIATLDESTYSVKDLKLDGGQLVMKLGEHELSFVDGEWVTSK